MKWTLLAVAICLLCFQIQSKTLSAEEFHYRRNLLREYANEVSLRRSNHHKNSADPPDHNKLVEMARYVMHNCGK